MPCWWLIYRSYFLQAIVVVVGPYVRKWIFIQRQIILLCAPHDLVTGLFSLKVFLLFSLQRFLQTAGPALHSFSFYREDQLKYKITSLILFATTLKSLCLMNEKVFIWGYVVMQTCNIFSALWLLRKGKVLKRGHMGGRCVEEIVEVCFSKSLLNALFI